ncbi:MAG: hypothetical protein Q9Q40_11400 [Acidobacteriota bacterium]|nr:hypothetical protein [Acidobacteriota bacterium]MDQ7086995.1 hypothetical protein [Acidobacteriota bacterium]
MFGRKIWIIIAVVLLVPMALAGEQQAELNTPAPTPGLLATVGAFSPAAVIEAVLDFDLPGLIAGAIGKTPTPPPADTASSGVLPPGETTGSSDVAPARGGDDPSGPWP